MRSFTAPLLPDDYLELVNPLWSSRELRGRIERIECETAEAVTVTIKPGWEWPGHRPGQYVRLGIAVNGVHHWRAYSLTSPPARADGCIAITPKLVPAGTVSPFLCGGAQPGKDVRPGTVARLGAIVRLGGVEGTFVLPEPVPRRLLFLSAGSGITPIASMLRSIAGAGAFADVVHVHCTRSAEAFIFGTELRALASRDAGYRLHEWISGERGRLRPEQLKELCADWREREAFLCGPSELTSAMGAWWKREGDPERLHLERFQPDTHVGDGARGEGGTIEFLASGIRAESDGEQPILLAGEHAGAELPHGCRMGICHSCVGRLHAGRVRDLRTGRVHGQPGELLRTCVNAPEGAIEIDL
jgi:ferredoxin-NADP reductase